MFCAREAACDRAFAQGIIFVPFRRFLSFFPLTRRLAMVSMARLDLSPRARELASTRERENPRSSNDGGRHEPAIVSRSDGRSLSRLATRYRLHRTGPGRDGARAGEKSH